MSNDRTQKQEQLANFLNSNHGLTALHASGALNDAGGASGIPSAAALGYESMSMPMSRRLSSFGLGGLGMLDRRGSGILMDDFLGRRASIGFDMGVDRLFDRRDSMDSTTAALEGAIMDFTRRRYSLLGGGGMIGASTSSLGVGDLNSLSTLTANLRPTSGLSSLFPNTSNDSLNLGTSSIMTAHQERLLLQQRELEQQQRQLEEQRRLLLANMGHTVGSGVANLGSGSLATQLQAQRLRGSLGLGSISRNSLGLGNLSGGSFGLGAMNTSMPLTQPSRPKQWQMCPICKSEAFRSKEEQEEHEKLCRDDAVAAAVVAQEESHRRRTALASQERNYDPSLDDQGPFQKLPRPIPLALESDKEWLTPLHCFVRQHCVEVFTATKTDVATPCKGKRRPIVVDQVGIRCPHCRHPDIVDEDGREIDFKEGRERGSTYYPTSINCIYNAAMNLLQRHLHACPHVPKETMNQFNMLKQDDARSGTSKRYWVESAQMLGLVDTNNGIRYRSPALVGSGRHTWRPEEPSSSVGEGTRGETDEQGKNMHGSSAPLNHPYGNSNFSSPGCESASTDQPDPSHLAGNSATNMTRTAPLVFPEDKAFATAFSYHLLSQMQPCAFTEADRLGKRKGLSPGFPGLACRHCYGGFGSGRFFPSSIKTLSDTSKTLNVLHNHMLRCRKCPVEIREMLESLRISHNDERGKMKFGSQKAFFGRIWRRLHGKEAPTDRKKLGKVRDRGDSFTEAQHQTKPSVEPTLSHYENL